MTSPPAPLSLVTAFTYDPNGQLLQTRQSSGGSVLRTIIPRSVRVSEAPSRGQSVITYDPGSSGAIAYTEAAKELAMQSAGIRQHG